MQLFELVSLAVKHIRSFQNIRIVIYSAIHVYTISALCYRVIYPTTRARSVRSTFLICIRQKLHGKNFLNQGVYDVDGVRVGLCEVLYDIDPIVYHDRFYM